MDVRDYEEIYDSVIAIADDCDGFGVFEKIKDEEVEKAKWIYLIYDCLSDVPLRRVEHIFAQKGIDKDSVFDELIH